eukprot:1141422-Pelagomonas_calceolata.AAC.4
MGHLVDRVLVACAVHDVKSNMLFCLHLTNRNVSHSSLPCIISFKGMCLLCKPQRPSITQVAQDGVQ